MPVSDAIANGFLTLLTTAGSALGVTLDGSITAGLSSTTPSATGTNITEPSGGDGYAVASVTLGSAASRQRANTATAAFPEATADWSGLTHVVIRDGAGVYIGSGALSGAPVTVPSGSIARFLAGQLTLTVT